jgi:hypothetical protein
MTLRGKTVSLLVLSLAALGALLVAQSASATHPRPRGATPLRVSLVPAFKSCTTPNRTHGAPLAFPSCNPPAQTSAHLTVGTPDSNGAGANSVGSALLRVKATAPEDLLITASITDVRCRAATSAAVCNSANTAAGADYSGQLQGTTMIRVSDHYNGPSLNEAATTFYLPLPVNIPCANTADLTTGGVCSVNTSANSVQPGAIPESATPLRAVIETSQIQVSDGGPDGEVSTADNNLFAVQGVFIP